jgi:hypothetical protein
MATAMCATPRNRRPDAREREWGESLAGHTRRGAGSTELNSVAYDEEVVCRRERELNDGAQCTRVVRNARLSFGDANSSSISGGWV